MTTNRTRAAGDTWLTPGDADLLHRLADPLPTEVRRDLAGILRRVGAVPDVVAASLCASIHQDYAAVLHRLPAFVGDLEHQAALGTATPIDVARAITELARYRTWVAAIAARGHVTTELGHAAQAGLVHAQHVLNILQKLTAAHTATPPADPT